MSPSYPAELTAAHTHRGLLLTSGSKPVLHTVLQGERSHTKTVLHRRIVFAYFALNQSQLDQCSSKSPRTSPDGVSCLDSVNVTLQLSSVHWHRVSAPQSHLRLHECLNKTVDLSPAVCVSPTPRPPQTCWPWLPLLSLMLSEVSSCQDRALWLRSHCNTSWHNCYCGVIAKQ